MVRTDGRRLVYGHVITKFLGWVDYLSYGAPLIIYMHVTYIQLYIVKYSQGFTQISLEACMLGLNINYWPK